MTKTLTVRDVRPDAQRGVCPVCDHRNASPVVEAGCEACGAFKSDGPAIEARPTFRSAVARLRELVAHDDTVNEAIAHVIADHDTMLDNLSSTQARCSALLEENRALRRQGELAAMLQAEAETRDDEAWDWTKHTESEEKEGLPVPRLEIRWTALGEGYWNWVARYNLVYRHLDGAAVAVPLGMTRVGMVGRRPVSSGKVETPFRDGVHIKHDAFALGLPAFAILDDMFTPIEAGTNAQRRG